MGRRVRRGGGPRSGPIDDLERRLRADWWKTLFGALSGADSSPYLMRIGRKRARVSGAALDLREADARALPYPASSFDSVTLTGNAFGYFSEARDDRAVLAEVRRVLAPSGCVYLDLADGAWLREHFDAFYAERLYTREEITSALIDSGFDAIESHGAMFGASDRNRDLGMMAKRMLVSARATSVFVARRQGA
jgi:D-alanine-D-alanine ligase